MATWKYHLNIKTEWDATKNAELSVQELASVIADRLAAIDFGDDDNFRRDNLVEDFQVLADDEGADTDEFDALFNELYNFADEVRLWVQTII